jgi:hypothetical protein
VAEVKRYVMSIGIRRYIRSSDIDRSREGSLESYLPTGVGHVTEVVHTTGVVI